MNKEHMISEILCLPPTAIEYHLGQQLAKTFHDKALIEVDAGLFDVEAYADVGECTFCKKTVIYNQMTTMWRTPEPEMMSYRAVPHVTHMGRMIMHNPGMVQVSAAPADTEQETFDRAKNAWLEVQWQGATLDVIVVNLGDRPAHYWIIADNEEVARNFFAAVSKWNMEIRGEVLVFDNGCWHKDVHLYQDIKGATFDNLILRGSLKEDIRTDIMQFFAARETYEEYGVPWKRGILFVGPAGNGKTHTVKALINSIEQPCLYVKSFKLSHGAPDDISIRQVFDRARRTAPCVLVLEDLDAQLTPQNRSFFLNELDGFAANIGLVTLATTNHPERLDPAILNRPSRFDRKYPFDLPELAERQAYIAMWNGTLKPQLRLSEVGVAKISELTEEFSFAYLKELFLSSMMRWIGKQSAESMDDVMTTQVEVLREQMKSVSTLITDEVEEPQVQAMWGPAARMHMARLHRGM